MASKFRLALIQMFVEKNRPNNLIKASKLIREATKNGAKVVALPEYFTCWMDPDIFYANKEPAAGPTSHMLSKAARDNNIVLFGGTYPEEIPGSHKLRNISRVFNPNGDLIGTFSKLHLFDVDLGPHMKVTESDVNVAGSSLVTVDTGYCDVGIGVCIDLRFPEVARLYGMKGCPMLLYMGGFSMKTGPSHLEALQRVRAIDNQLYVANVGSATNFDAPYVTYGHSGVADPWGDMISKAGADEEIVYADIDLDQVNEIRRRMPIDKLRRDDLYTTSELKK